MDLEKELSLHLPLSSFEEERGSRGHGRPWGERTEGKVNGRGRYVCVHSSREKKPGHWPSAPGLDYTCFRGQG